VLRGFCIGNGVDVYPGQITEIADDAARLYILKGKVEAVIETAPRPIEANESEPTPTARKGAAKRGRG